jgi:hypothetical protein
VGGVDRSLLGHRLAASQPDIGSDPTHVLRPMGTIRSLLARPFGRAVAPAARREVARAGKIAPLLARRPVTYRCAL